MPYVAGPFDSMHLYLQWGGLLPGGESFSCGLRFGEAGEAMTSLDPVGMIAGAVTAVKNYHSAVNTAISPRAVLNHVKLNAIGEDGLYVEDGTTEAIVANTAGGGNVAQTPSNQVAHAISLTTGFSRGPAHRGRFYLPLPTSGLVDDGRISAATAGTIGATTTTFIAALNALNVNWKVAVFSRKLGAPAHRFVVGNQVGRVLDTQRRRRRSLDEAYV